jgi:hypothetical protein
VNGTTLQRPPTHPADLAAALGRLLRMKTVVLLCLLLAVAAGLFAGYHVSLSPPGLESREVGLATAEVDVLLDLESSQLRDSTADLSPLVQRAVVYAAAARSERVRATIAREAGIPRSDLALTGAPSQNPAGRADAGTAQSRSNALTLEGPHNRVTFTNSPGLPVITVSVLAPTADAASRIVAVAADAAAGLVRREARAADLPRSRRLTARVVGTPVASAVSSGPAAPTLAGTVAAISFVVLLLIALALANILQGAHAARAVGES